MAETVPYEYLDRLRRSFERFEALPDEVWSELQTVWHVRTVARGETLTREGETERCFSFILDGAQRMYFTTPDGNDHTVAFVYAGDYSGLPGSFFLQRPAAYGLEALSDGRVLAADWASLSGLMEQHVALERWARHLFMWALNGRMKREREMLTLTAEERYERLLRESPQIVQLAPLKHIASYLGMTPETLSRVRAGRS